MINRIVLACLAWLAFTLPAAAHWADLAVADVQVHDRDAVVTLTVPTGLVAEADANHDGRLSAAEIQGHAAPLAAKLGEAVRLEANGAAPLPAVEPSEAAAPSADLAGGANTTLQLRYTWQAPIKDLGMRYTLFVPGAASARCLATIAQGGEVRNVVFTPASPELGGTSRVSGFISFVGLGIEHILMGYDHVLFLISLLMLGGGLRYLLKVVTAFTAAHSITLTLAALQLVSVPSRLVESAIALTIVYVAAENFWRKSLDGRWVVTLLFGLVHGFGFASALAKTGLPRQNLALSLAGFNVGVELGQLVVVSVAFGLLSLIRTQTWEPNFRRWVSAGVVGIGLFWFVQRAFFA
ncbi:MAG: High-affinity nickel-transporter [Cyanobacteria bacterium RYN_339]|nr:High-affinity nickel-transporter [Cyanobacteria bacterium RYN_339]